MHDLLESLSKFGIEDCVNHRVHEAVHVAQPRGENEDGHPGTAVRVQFRANRVHDVAREERHPADQEDAFKWREREEEKIIEKR